eukprot:TRINITY_DN9263_c0_g1_i1.p1 TRINITY_DN9263_c0_g1~~TRINITY_DN9263_c0_g1_i1.p1  ORF type:complete len:132 (-),score=22.11 TRINITY_DN9263_c0_g1_i1:82-477(-)
MGILTKSHLVQMTNPVFETIISSFTRMIHATVFKVIVVVILLIWLLQVLRKKKVSAFEERITNRFYSPFRGLYEFFSDDELRLFHSTLFNTIQNAKPLKPKTLTSSVRGPDGQCRSEKKVTFSPENKVIVF